RGGRLGLCGGAFFGAGRGGGHLGTCGPGGQSVSRHVINDNLISYDYMRGNDKLATETSQCVRPGAEDGRSPPGVMVLTEAVPIREYVGHPWDACDEAVCAVRDRRQIHRSEQQSLSSVLSLPPSSFLL